MRTLQPALFAFLTACTTISADGPGGSDGKADDQGVAPELREGALANLRRLEKEIDYQNHLSKYRLNGAVPEQFMGALEQEYAEQEPEQFQARVRALASAVFFARPDLLPPEGGKRTPFHGLTMDDYSQLMAIEDAVWEVHAQAAGGNEGVRPFSVCETSYMIEEYVKKDRSMDAFASYKDGYLTFKESCPARDLAEWYNFRGLGHLRPSWGESNIMDRYLRRMLDACQSSSSGACGEFKADRLAFRQKRNQELAARQMFYALDTEAYMTDPNNEVLLLQDLNGDGVGDWFRPGPGHLKTGETVNLVFESTGEFSGTLKMSQDGQLSTVAPDKLEPVTAIMSGYDPAALADADWGMLGAFPQVDGCMSLDPQPGECPMLRRFYSLIDRHENFYQTYSSVNLSRANMSKQPSPFVACSVTIAASNAWAFAGTPPGGRAGMIFLWRVPFDQILTGSEKNVATADPPDVINLGQIYRGEKQLDFSKVWFDVASLSNNQFQSEHEISKFGNVPAEMIETILVIGDTGAGLGSPEPSPPTP